MENGYKWLLQHNAVSLNAQYICILERWMHLHLSNMWLHCVWANVFSGLMLLECMYIWLFRSVHGPWSVEAVLYFRFFLWSSQLMKIQSRSKVQITFLTYHGSLVFQWSLGSFTFTFRISCTIVHQHSYTSCESDAHFSVVCCIVVEISALVTCQFQIMAKQTLICCLVSDSFMNNKITILFFNPQF